MSDETAKVGGVSALWERYKYFDMVRLDPAKANLANFQKSKLSKMKEWVDSPFLF